MMRKRILAWLLLAALAPLPAPAAVVELMQGQRNLPTVNLGSAQTGNGDTTNTVDRGAIRQTCLLKITSTVGATPTVTVNILGSMDGTNFFNAAYATAAAQETPAVAAITITTATTNYYMLRANIPWRYLKLNYSANTNVTLTSDVYC